MRFSTTLARRSLLGRPGRTVFSVLGIAVGIATVVGVFTLDHNTVEGMRRRAEQREDEWRPDLEVRAPEGLDDAYGELRSVSGVAEVAPFFQNEVRAEVLVPEGEEPRRRRGLLLAADARALGELGAYTLVDGRGLDPQAEEAEVLVTAVLAERLGVRVGDALSLGPPARRARVDCVDGELREVRPGGAAPATLAFRVVGLLAREKLGRRANGDVFVVDYGWGRRLYDDAHVESRFWVRRDPGVDIESLQAELAGNFSYDVGKSILVGQAAEERAFRNGVRMAGLLALVLGLYVIFHTLSMSLVERLREVATLHALGATRRQTALVFFLEAAFVAGAGGALGLAGGLGLARGLLAVGITTLGSGHHLALFEVPWGAALALTLAGIAVALAGSVYPLLRARAVRTSATLRGEGAFEASAGSRGFHLLAVVLLVGLLPVLYFLVSPVVGAASSELVGAVVIGVGVLGALVAVPFLVPSLIAGLAARLARPFARRWPFAGEMAAHSMREGRRRISVATSALALVVAAFCGLKGMVRSLHAEVDAWAEGAIADKVFLEGLPERPYAELADVLRGAPGVVGIEWNAARTFAPFLLVGLRVDDLAAHGPLARDPALRAELAAGRGVILSRRVAKNLGYGVGDTLQASAAAGGVLELRVLAISDAYGYFPDPDERLYGVVSDRVLAEEYCLDTETADRVALVLEPGADADRTVQALAAALGGAPRSRTGASIRALQAEDIDADFLLFDVILGLTAVLAGLGVLNGQLLSALERTKELGILKALGTTRGQVAGMVALEALVVGVVGGALGVALGSALGPVIVGTLEELSDLALPHRTAGPWLLVSGAGAVVLALLATVYPIWRMNRVDAVRAVRTG